MFLIRQRQDVHISLTALGRRRSTHHRKPSLMTPFLTPPPGPAASTTPQRSDVAGLLATAAFAAALLSPLRHYVGPQKKVQRDKNKHDSFPISTYPMFSADRAGRIVVPHVVGETADGERINLSYRLYGTGGLNQVRKQVARAVRQGHADTVAQNYADALHRYGNPEEISEVLVVRSRFIFSDYFAGDRRPFAENVHARCAPGGTATLCSPGILARPDSDTSMKDR
ncbi:hypothetical protein [Citricoccus sp. NR2]|uniref:hypothetical protein n=1 Tax=Citricoccus sp. NR2 TaxID=3004095 RepID=UPI0022DE0B32|nr:hypothetical protein [Citricoccus sp. NR2]WBL18745.1 hypothetical protein O1A05_13460 [Citricoccus sp. NR2]